MTQLAVVLGYLAVLAVVGVLARRQAKPGQEDFFLASRSLGPMVLFLSMAATNFSAFTVFGFSGAGYRIGYAYYPIMAFGTGFMALSFLYLGIPLWRAGRRLGAITPPELIGLRFRSRPLRVAYLLVMIAFTLPYLAIQPMGAGYALQGLFGTPYWVGAVLVTLAVVGYVLLGGLRGEAWADVVQGVLLLGTMIVVFIGVARALGGLGQANARVLAEAPELLGRPGGTGGLLPLVWLSYMVLWTLCDPMFPQLFQRFLAARNTTALKTTAVLYPLITGLLFFLPVAVGVVGRLVVPGLEGKAADTVLPQVVARLLPGWAGGVAIAGALAALMTTMDSQLLTLSSMVTRDIGELVPRRWVRFFPDKRLVVVVLAGAGLVLALRPVGTILELATETFTGLAVLFPVTLAAVYWRRANPWAGLASIVTGEVLVVAYHFKLLPSYGFLPAMPIVATTAAVLIVGSLVAPTRGLEPFARIDRSLVAKWVPAFGLVFLLANDFWAWGRMPLMLAGLPAWLWYHIGLNMLLFFLMLLLVRSWRDSAATSEDAGAPS